MADYPISFELDAGATARMLSHSDEQRLLSALRENSEAAYEELITRFQQPVYNLAYRLMSDPCDTADVVQEVFLKVFRSVGNFRGQSSLKTWIYRITVNEAYNHRRWFSRHRKQEVGLEEEDEQQSYHKSLADPGRSPLELAVDRETQLLIEECLLQVNSTYRAAVILRDIEDLSYDEIAEVLQVSLGTVKSRIVRGREGLRQALAQRLRPESALQSGLGRAVPAQVKP